MASVNEGRAVTDYRGILGMRLTYRPRQLKAILDIFGAWRRGRKRIVCCAPTAFGKSGVAAGVIEAGLRRGKRVLFLGDRKRIVKQARDRLRDFGIDAAIIMAGEPWDLSNPVQIASVQTLARRQIDWVPDILVPDETHRATSPLWRQIFARYPDALICGLTATPVAPSGRGLSELFEEIIPTASVRELIDDGTLCPFKYFLPELLDTSGMRISKGDVTPEEQEARLAAKPGVVGDFVKYWLANARGRPTLTFAPSIRVAGMLCDAANAGGISAVAVDSTMDDDEADEALADLEAGRIDMIVLVGMWIEALDSVKISCVVFMTLTESIVRFLQMIGRGFRTDPDDPDKVLLIFDHMGNAGRVINGEFKPKHGMPDWSRIWDLKGRRIGKGGAVAELPQPLRVCGSCFGTFSPAPICPHCLVAYVPKPRKVPVKIKGEIVELTEEQAAQHQYEQAEVQRARWEASSLKDYQEIARRLGHKPQWAQIQWGYRKKKLEAIAERKKQRAAA